jgi:hypothetical protein
MASRQLTWRLPGTMSSTMLYISIIVANFPLGVAADGQSDSEFAFNVFTDLAP